MYKPTPGPLPRDMFTLVTSYGQPEHTIHCLSINSKTVVFQSNFSTSLTPEVSWKDPEWLGEDFREHNRRMHWTLEIIQTFLGSIDMEHTNWVYVNRTPDGYRILPRRKALYTLIKCPLWTHCIYENEIKITRWNGDAQANGFWNGKQVDIWYGWDHVKMKCLNRAMEAAFAVRDLDLTYEVYGHLLDSDGHILGMVVESTWGRRVELADRMIVYEAIAKLQRHSCIFYSIYGSASGILIAGGKVRLADLPSIEYFPPNGRTDFEALADRLHWSALDDLFSELEQDIVSTIPHYQFIPAAPVVLLPTTPYPQKPLGVNHGVLKYVGFPRLYSPTGHDIERRKASYKFSECLDMLSTNLRTQLEYADTRVTIGSQRWVIQIDLDHVRRYLRQSSKAYTHTYTAARAKPYSRDQRRGARFLSPGSDCTSEEGATSRFEEVA